MTLEPGDDEIDTRLLRAVLRHLGASVELDPLEGGKFLALAFRGLSARQHFDAHHPDQLERGVEMAPPGEADREAWLFGYWFDAAVPVPDPIPAPDYPPPPVACRGCGCIEDEWEPGAVTRWVEPDLCSACEEPT